jgi:spore coat protein A
MSKGKKFTRRQLLKGGAIAGAGFLVPWPSITSKVLAGTKGAAGVAISSSVPTQPDPSPLATTDFFKTPLVAKIPFAKPKYRIPGVVAYYELEMKQHAGFPFYGALLGSSSFKVVAPAWGYDDGSGTIFNGGGYIGYLGPTIVTRKFEQVLVKWINHLPGGDTEPFGLLDPNLVPSDPKLRNYGPLGGRAVVHIHGMHTLSKFDGGPENGFNPGEWRIYEYPNIQDAASLWYHDHAIGVTRLNAYAGLAALYWIRDAFEDGLNLPKGDLEIPLVLQDKAFYMKDGNLSQWYPNPWQPETFGNTILVNAQLWPVLEVEPRRYRFRIYNGANARFFRLRLSGEYGKDWSTVPNSVAPFYQIGAEAGLLPNAERLDTILLGNGERADVVVDFKGLAGREIYLTNDAMTPFSPGPGDALDPTANDPIWDAFPNINVMQLMKIKVKTNTVSDKTRIMPSPLRPITKLDPAKAAKFRQITLVEQPYPPNPDFNMIWLNKRPFMVGDGAYAETPKLGTTEVWQFVNMTPDTHPMHIHLVKYQVLGRQALAPNPDYHPDTDPEYKQYLYGARGDGAQVAPTGDLRGTEFVVGSISGPEPNESGFKETVKANPGEATYVIMKFEDFAGKFVYHCHILDHEENDMMQYMQTKWVLGKESADETEGTVPTEFALDQNFPNPFNPATQIRFQLPQDGRAKLTIFNTAGQEVAKLVDGDLAAGSHVISWNANNMASGAYFFRLEAGTFSAVKRMLLLK